MPEAVSPAELVALVALIVGEQCRPDRMIPALGDDPEGVRAQIQALDPPWTETARVVRDSDGRLIGAVFVELDAELGQAWIIGPWVTGDDQAWARFAGLLMEAALAQVPATITRRTLSGHTGNIRLAELARQLGWRPGRVSHVLMADRSLIDGWPDDHPGNDLRPATTEDRAAVEMLHEAEFAGTYATAGQLLRGSDGENGPVVLVAEDGDAGVVGYVAGRIHADGEGYIDFVAVNPSCRRNGLGRQLVTTLTRQLIVRSPKGQVCLAVHDERAAARALYAQLGFNTLLSMVGYSAHPEIPSDSGGP